MPTTIPDVLINGIFALVASFSGAWVALKFQERHEDRKAKRAKKESGSVIYLILSEQLTVLKSLRDEKPSYQSRDLWLTAISRLADQSMSVTFDTKILQEFLPDISSGLFRDIVIAQNRFLMTVSHLKSVVEGSPHDACSCFDKFRDELASSIVLMNSVTGDFGDYMNFKYATNFPKSEAASLMDQVVQSLSSPPIGN